MQKMSWIKKGKIPYNLKGQTSKIKMEQKWKILITQIDLQMGDYETVPQTTGMDL